MTLDLAALARRVGDAVGHETYWMAPDGTLFNHDYLVEQAGGCIACRAEAAALAALRECEADATRRALEYAAEVVASQTWVPADAKANVVSAIRGAGAGEGVK